METLCQFRRKLNFRGTNATQMQLVHNNLFHFLYYNSIIYFFDSMNMTTTHQNNHPTPNLNVVMKCNSGLTGALRLKWSYLIWNNYYLICVFP